MPLNRVKPDWTFRDVFHKSTTGAMNEEGSHASFATLETRLVSAGKIGVKVLLQTK